MLSQGNSNLPFRIAVLRYLPFHSQDAVPSKPSCLWLYNSLLAIFFFGSVLSLSLLQPCLLQCTSARHSSNTGNLPKIKEKKKPLLMNSIQPWLDDQ